jgi:hypothetical protein
MRRLGDPIGFSTAFTDEFYLYQFTGNHVDFSLRPILIEYRTHPLIDPPTFVRECVYSNYFPCGVVSFA